MCSKYLGSAGHLAMSHSHKRVGLGLASSLILVGPFHFIRAGMTCNFQTPTHGAMSIIGDVGSPAAVLMRCCQDSSSNRADYRQFLRCL